MGLLQGIVKSDECAAFQMEASVTMIHRKIGSIRRKPLRFEFTDLKEFQRLAPDFCHDLLREDLNRALKTSLLE